MPFQFWDMANFSLILRALRNEMTFFGVVIDMNSGVLNLLYSKRLQNIEDAPFSNSEKNVCDIMYEPNFNQISLDLNDRKSKLNYHYESSIPSGIMPTELEKNAVQKPNLDIGRYFAERVSRCLWPFWGALRQNLWFSLG